MLSSALTNFFFPERIIHLQLCDEGYACARFDEPCLCGHHHREYYYMRPEGSLEEIEEIVRECLAEIGEANALW